MCDVAVCVWSCNFSRSPGWMIITTHSTETSFFCLRGASLTRKKSARIMALCVQSQRRSYFTAQSRVCVRERERERERESVCVCERERVSEHEEETWPVWGWDWGKFMPVLFDIMGLLSLLTSSVQQHPCAPLVCETPSTLTPWLWYSCNYHLLLDCHRKA